MADSLRSCPECGGAQLCRHDAMGVWALGQLEAYMRRNMPAVKAVRQLRADSRETKKALDRALRAQASKQASTQRKLNQRLTDLELASRKRQASQDAEMEKRRWDLLAGSL